MTTKTYTYEAIIKVEIEVPTTIPHQDITAALDKILEHSTASEAIEDGLWAWDKRLTLTGFYLPTDTETP